MKLIGKVFANLKDWTLNMEAWRKWSVTLKKNLMQYRLHFCAFLKKTMTKGFSSVNIFPLVSKEVLSYRLSWHQWRRNLPTSFVGLYVESWEIERKLRSPISRNWTHYLMPHKATSFCKMIQAACHQFFSDKNQVTNDKWFLIALVLFCSDNR